MNALIVSLRYVEFDDELRAACHNLRRVLNSSSVGNFILWSGCLLARVVFRTVVEITHITSY